MNPELHHSLAQLDESKYDQVQDIAGRKKLQRSTAATGTGAGRWMDDERQNLAAYEYLCRIGEAKQWIEAVIEEEIGSIVDMDTLLQDGVILAKLARFFEPACVKRIFVDPKLQFRHSDNTNYFFAACKKSGLPDLFLFELTDVYDKKNVPKVIYCIHALSHFLAKKGIAPKIKSLVGQLDFTQEELEKTQNSLLEAGVSMPHFGSVEGALAKELNEPTEEEKRQLYLEQHVAEITACQAFARGYLAKKAYHSTLGRLRECECSIVALQALVRGYLLRKRLEQKKLAWASSESLVISMQSLFRGAKQRRAYLETLEHYKSEESLKKIVKVQAFYKGKLQGKQYRELEEQAIPVKAIQSFIHLLDDSDKDIEEERELERLKQLVISLIRENNDKEQNLSDLDIKIALLVRNRLTLDEVIKGTAKYNKKAASASALNSAATLPRADSTVNIFSAGNLKSLDKTSRQRLELYQNLFYILQTQPKYLGRLVFLVKQTKFRAFMDNVLLTLFNFANSAREEYLLLRLFHFVIQEEMKAVQGDVEELVKGNPIFIKMVVHYNRGAKERAYLRDLLQPLVREILESTKLDLETDPLQIYRQLIKEEESRTGEASHKPFDISREKALEDPEVQRVFQHHLDQLCKFTDKFLDAIIKSLHAMPYGIRFIARTLMEELSRKFPSDEEKVLKAMGNLVYYRYMNPAVVAPEAFDVIETLISPLQRKNLAEISKILQQVSMNREFGSEAPYLTSLNAYVRERSQRMFAFFRNVATIPEAHDYFQISGFSDATTKQKPVIYVAPHDIYNTHALLLETLSGESPKDDPLALVLEQLGALPEGCVTVDYTGRSKDAVNDEEKRKPGNEISLTLSSRILDNYVVASTPGGEAGVAYKDLFLETKRWVLMLIRVQSGRSLTEILDKPVEPEEEEMYRKLVAVEGTSAAAMEEEPLSPDSGVVVELKTPATLADLKSFLRRQLETLESMYTSFDAATQRHFTAVTASTQYQGLLTTIGQDIRNKHRRRMQRKAELRSLNKTVGNLCEKEKYLEEQTQSYHDYINSCMAQLTSNRGKKHGSQAGSGNGKMVLPFTPQWYHLQELKKLGKVPQFGSYKYTAETLRKRGVLLSIDGQPEGKSWDKISLTISSDESGIFQIEGSIMGIPLPGGKTELKLEDLLQYQFDNQQVISLMDGSVRANVNLLIYLINRKFYQ